MSILIKGMEMPKGCGDCNFYYTDYEEGTATCLATSCYVTPQQYSKGNRDSDCPLVEVPTPHGDLVDRDDLIDEINRVTFVKRYDYNVAYNIVTDAETIIEAEVGE